VFGVFSNVVERLDGGGLFNFVSDSHSLFLLFFLDNPIIVREEKMTMGKKSAPPKI
jgi:hypothetical protein